MLCLHGTSRAPQVVSEDNFKSILRRVTQEQRTAVYTVEARGKNTVLLFLPLCSHYCVCVHVCVCKLFCLFRLPSAYLKLSTLQDFQNLPWCHYKEIHRKCGPTCLNTVMIGYRQGYASPSTWKERGTVLLPICTQQDIHRVPRLQSASGSDCGSPLDTT